ncbi:hypothetical protein [Comamonas sp.]|uniref:hypothetical protein n=1 Tax=Comamonas sp. TaxID=34028 RepID=UPI00289B2A9B|nr:hypothetical protein [Comamonas sp.]
MQSTDISQPIAKAVIAVTVAMAARAGTQRFYRSVVDTELIAYGWFWKSNDGWLVTAGARASHNEVAHHHV